MSHAICLIFAAFIGTLSAEVVKNVQQCPDVNADACSVHEVRITPCKNGVACQLKLGKSAQLSFDYTPNFVATKLKSEVYGLINTEKVLFESIGKIDACKYSPCPTEVGKQQTFDFSFEIGKKLPSGSYKMEWRLWNEDDAAQVCCFQTNLRLKK